MIVLRKLVSKGRESGLLYTVQLLTDRLVPKILLDVRAVFLCELDLADASESFHPDSDIDRVEADELERLIESHEVLGRMRSEFSPGARVWVLREGDEIEAFMLLAPEVILQSNWFRIDLSKDDIAGVFLWVSPEHRGKGLGPRMNRHVSQECARLGYSRIVSTVDALNRNSLRADEKVGYQRIGKIRILRIFGFGGVFLRRMRRLGWWTSKHLLVLSVEDLERTLRAP